MRLVVTARIGKAYGNETRTGRGKEKKGYKLQAKRWSGKCLLSLILQKKSYTNQNRNNKLLNFHVPRLLKRIWNTATLRSILYSRLDIFIFFVFIMDIPDSRKQFTVPALKIIFIRPWLKHIFNRYMGFLFARLPFIEYCRRKYSSGSCQILYPRSWPI